MTTLRGAADYIQKLPKAQQQQPHWQIHRTVDANARPPQIVIGFAKAAIAEEGGFRSPAKRSLF
jgi:hypothetical protein